eukprot:1194998-Prorocentrum_minimum.AAC.4
MVPRRRAAVCVVLRARGGGGGGHRRGAEGRGCHSGGPGGLVCGRDGVPQRHPLRAEPRVVPRRRSQPHLPAAHLPGQ